MEGMQSTKVIRGRISRAMKFHSDGKHQECVQELRWCISRGLFRTETIRCNALLSISLSALKEWDEAQVYCMGLATSIAAELIQAALDKAEEAWVIWREIWPEKTDAVMDKIISYFHGPLEEARNALKQKS